MPWKHKKLACKKLFYFCTENVGEIDPGLSEEDLHRWMSLFRG
jgi:hypothetical protein